MQIISLRAHISNWHLSVCLWLNMDSDIAEGFDKESIAAMIMVRLSKTIKINCKPILVKRDIFL